MGTYPMRIQRLVSYTEYVDAMIEAPSVEEAEVIAVGLGNGEGVISPPVLRYNTFEREPLAFDFMGLEHGE